MLDENEKYQILKTIDELFDKKEPGDIVDQNEIIEETGYEESKVNKVLLFLSQNYYIEAEFASGDNKILTGFVKNITPSGNKFLLEFNHDQKPKKMSNIDHIKYLLLELDKIPDFTGSEIDEFRNDVRMILKNIFPNEDYITEEKKISFVPSFTSVPVENELKKRAWLSGKTHYKSFLNRIIKEIEMFGEESQMEKKIKDVSNKIFIVHGQDRKIRTEVDLLLRKIGLIPVFLYEQSNQNKTIIEKFLEHSDVQFAIVLLTPDDKGCKVRQNNKQLMKRPRQNVIFEMGYFIGKLNRENICVIYRETKDFELLSDFSGCLYIKFDKIGKWKQLLIKELQNAGYSVTADDI